MTTFNVSVNSTFHDAAFATRAGGDTYNILDCTLTIDGDTRFGPNTTTTTGSPVSLAINQYLGGTISIDASNVWLIPYNGGNGNVPAADTVISQGGVSAKLLGVWSAINAAPTAVAAAMPDTGYLKVRQKSGGNYSAGSHGSTRFNGGTNYVNCGVLDDLNFQRTDTFSVSFWIKYTAPAGLLGYVIARNGAVGPTGWDVYISTTNVRMELLKANPGAHINAGANFASMSGDGQFHHFVLTWNGDASPGAAGVLCYIDGVLQATVIGADTLAANSISSPGATLDVGQTLSTNYLNYSQLAHVAVYNKTLSLPEVQAIYGAGVPPVLTSLSTAANLLRWFKGGVANTYPTWIDSSAGAHSGTMTNMAVGDLLLDGPSDPGLTNIGACSVAPYRSIRFEGTDDFVTMGNVLDFHTANHFSLGCFFRTTDATYKTLIAKRTGAANYTGYVLTIATGGLLSFILRDSTGALLGVTTVGAYNTGAWQHVEVTYDGSGTVGGIVIYVNGIAVPVTTTPGVIGEISNAASFALGADVTPAYALIGYMCHANVYNKTLSQPEVAAVYAGGKENDLTLLSSAANLVGWWKMGGALDAYPTLRDYSTGHHDGTMTNMLAADFTNDSPNSAMMDGLAAPAMLNIDTVGWIEVCGDENGSISVPKLGTFRTRGDWFQLGVTSGVRGQTFALPTSGGTNFWVPAVFIETAVGSGVYRPWPCLTADAGGGWTVTDQGTDDRSPFVQCDGSLIRIGANAAAASIGKLPVAGLRVMLPNVCLQSNTVAARATTAKPNATLTTRFEFSGTYTYGSYDYQKCSCCWYADASDNYALVMVDAAFADGVAVQKVYTPITIDNVCVGITNPASAGSVSFTLNYTNGGTVSNLSVGGAGTITAGSRAIGISTNRNLTFTSCSFWYAVQRAVILSYGSLYSIYNVDCTFTDCLFVAGVYIVGCERVTLLRPVYLDRHVGVQDANYPETMTINGMSKDIVVDGMLLFPGVANIHPYSALVTVSGSCQGIIVKNIGSPSARLEMGTVSACGYIVASSAGYGTRVLRCYVQNTRVGLVNESYSELGTTEYSNVWGDAADGVLTSFAPDMIYRGCYAGGTINTTFGLLPGLHFWDAFNAATTGRMGIVMNEPSAGTASQVTTTGTAAWSGYGTLLLPGLGDTCTWEWSYFILGYTGLSNVAPTITGGATKDTNFLYEYCLDKADGYGYAIRDAWIDVVNVTPVGNNLSKTGGALAWDALVSTTQILVGDGYVEFTTAENNTAKVGGLSSDAVYLNPQASIDYGIYTKSTGLFSIIENNVQQLSLPYSPGDVLRVQRTGTVVTYYWNGTLVYTSLIASSGPLRFVGAFNHVGSTINGVTFSGATSVVQWKTLNAANLSAEAGISPTLGFRPKVRATCTIAAAATSNYLTGIYWQGATDAVNQQIQYPLENEL